MDVLDGEWVLLIDDEIIDSNSDPSILFAKAEKLNDERVIVSKIPSSSCCFY